MGSKKNVFASLVNAGKCDNVWAMCMHEGSKSNGTLTIGGADPRLSEGGKVTYVPDVGRGFHSVQVSALTLGGAGSNSSSATVSVNAAAILDTGTNVRHSYGQSMGGVSVVRVVLLFHTHTYTTTQTCIQGPRAHSQRLPNESPVFLSLRSFRSLPSLPSLPSLLCPLPSLARRPIARALPLASPPSLTDRHRCFCWDQRRARRYRRPCAVTPLSVAVPTCGGTSAWTSRTPRSMRTRHSP